MAHKRRHNTTRIEIIQAATRMFLEHGYTGTSVKAISTSLDISTGNLTFYFPTKEHLLAILVEMLCKFQWELLEHAADEGQSSLMALCLELPAMAAVCEENEIAKDFFLSAYTHPMTIDIIRRTDIDKARKIFAPYCPDWDENQYAEAETLVSGIEYATLMTTPHAPSLDLRVAGAMNSILTIYQVPEAVRREKIDKLLAMDYRALGREVLHNFMVYINDVNDHALDALLSGS